MRVLVINAGSSSLKLQLVEPGDELSWQENLPVRAGRFDLHTARNLLTALPSPPDAVGHRIVHGGPHLHDAALCDDHTLKTLEDLVELAPLHQPIAIEALRLTRRTLPNTPHFCCFDTAFHATMPAAASTYALPYAWRQRWGLRKYGFHGLSHAWVARRTPEILRCPPNTLRIVSCHLGAGASTCAIDHGRSVDTSMGFTPLAGLVMATRSGDLDPGLQLWLLQAKRLTLSQLTDGLQHESGLQALTGTSDMRLVLQRLRHGDAQAKDAIEIVAYRLATTIAAMSAAMNGLDVLAFTGGIGEHAAPVRAYTATKLTHLGIVIDHDLNEAADSTDRDISTPTAPARAVIIKAQEQLEIARQGRALLN